MKFLNKEDINVVVFRSICGILFRKLSNFWKLKNSRRVKRVKLGKDELIVKLNKTNKLNENIKN